MSKSRYFTTGDEATVRPVHVTDPHDFYVRLTEDDDWVLTFQELVEAHQPLPLPWKPPPQLGQLVCLQHEKYGWARGVVISFAKDGRYGVRTLDYGDVIYEFHANMRRLECGDATAPKAIHCRLHMCEPNDGNTWSPSSIETFLDYLGTKAMKMTVMSLALNGDQLVVDLNTCKMETVSKMLVIAGAACFGNYPQQVNRLQPVIPTTPLRKYRFVRDSLEVGVEAEVRVLHFNGHKFDVVRKERYDSYQPIAELLEVEFAECEWLDNADVTVGTPVVCRLNRRALDRYFRGEIIGTKLDTQGIRQVNINLVDIGEQTTVYPTKNTLRKCKSLFLEEPTFAISCSLNELQKSNNSFSTHFAPGLCLCVRAEHFVDSTKTHVVSIVENSLSKI